MCNGKKEGDETTETSISDSSSRPTPTESGSTTTRHDWTESDHPSVTIVRAVAAVTDRTATGLPPLQETIDPDALDSLLGGSQSSTTSVSFDYADTAVWVQSDGAIEVRADVRPVESSD